jgi:predicted flap endonuclease-1-like 5' DNA nuclease
MKSSCFTWVLIILVAVFGLALGLLVGWVVWPVEWINASPENLRLEFQTDYLEMAMDSYQVNQNAALAQERYLWLGEQGPEALAAVQENPTWVSQEQIDAYVTAISSPEAGAAPLPTPAPTSTAERLKPFLWWILLVVLLALAAIVLLAIVVLRMLRGRKPEEVIQPTEPSAEAVEPAPEEETPGLEAGVTAVAAVELVEQEPAPTDELVRATEIPETVEAAPDAEGEGRIGAAGIAAAALVAAAVAGGEDEEAIAESVVEEAEAEPVAEESEAQSSDLLPVAVALAGVEGLEWALEENVPETPVEPAPEEGPLVVPEGEWVAEPTGAETRPLESTDFYGKYNLKIIDIEGIGPAYAAKLEELGITTTHGLLQQCSTPKGRQQLADMSGISRTLVLEWANHADMMRIRGIGPQWSDLLEMAGVNTVREMAMRKPDHLHQKLIEINEEKKLVRQLPSLAQVEDWVEQAKELPPILMY